jgi:hypothetical protein
VLPVPAEKPHWEMFWVDELAQGRPLSVTAEYAQLVTRLSLAARDSAQTGKMITVGEA